MFTLVILLITAQVILADDGEKAFDGNGCWYIRPGLKLPEDQLEVIPDKTDVVECKKFCEAFSAGEAPCYVLQIVNGVCYRNKNKEANWKVKMEDQADSTQYQLASCGDEKDDVTKKEDDVTNKEEDATGKNDTTKDTDATEE